MTIISSRAKLVKDFRITVDDGRDHSVCLDLPPEMGTDRGPTALELGVMSFAGCVATIFILVIKKMRLQLNDLEIVMKAEKPESASTITKADYTVVVKSPENEQKIERAFELTRKTCPVGLLFEKAGVEVSFNLRIS